MWQAWMKLDITPIISKKKKKKSRSKSFNQFLNTIFLTSCSEAQQWISSNKTFATGHISLSTLYSRINRKKRKPFLGTDKVLLWIVASTPNTDDLISSSATFQFVQVYETRLGWRASRRRWQNNSVKLWLNSPLTHFVGRRNIKAHWLIYSPSP